VRFSGGVQDPAITQSDACERVPRQDADLKQEATPRRSVAPDVHHANDAISGEHRRGTRCIGSARVIERNRPSERRHAREGSARNAEVKGLPVAFQALRAALAAGR